MIPKKIMHSIPRSLCMTLRDTKTERDPERVLSAIAGLAVCQRDASKYPTTKWENLVLKFEVAVMAQ